ncbi:MAG: DUF1476 domain-containing protein [Alphaproteobacteria bacterium]|nr:DUF1476 domain-containing protein [Alphaproteobacteria bacterium]
MSTFDERQKGFETKFKHDQETAFKITARRNKLIGLWTAKQLGLEGAAAENYAKSVVAADMEKPGDADVVAKILKDLAAKGIQLTEHRIRSEMDALAAEARKQITGK